MPLAWAHAEHIKLLRSLRDGVVFDMPPQTVARYITSQSPSPLRIWRFNNKLSYIPQGKILRVELAQSALIHWSIDNWQTTTDTHTQATIFGSHFADLALGAATRGHHLLFTFFWSDSQSWEGDNYGVEVL